MAIVTANTETKAKLVYRKTGEENETSRTFSNLVSGVQNQNLYDGLAAVAGLIDADADTGLAIVRVDENTLIDDSAS